MNDLEVLRVLCEAVEAEAIRLARSEWWDAFPDGWAHKSQSNAWPSDYYFEHGDGKNEYRQRVIDRIVRGVK